MKTVRDHLASNPAAPAPPSGATHILCWEPQPRRATRWELAALDGHPDYDGSSSDLSHNADWQDLAGFVSLVLGRPVTLSPRFEVPDVGGDTAVAYYVSPR